MTPRRRIDHGKLDRADVLREVHGLPLVEHHLPLDLPEACDDLAEDQQDQPGVDEDDAESLACELEANRMGGQQIDEQQNDQRIAAEHREFERPDELDNWSPPRSG